MKTKRLSLALIFIAMTIIFFGLLERGVNYLHLFWIARHEHRLLVSTITTQYLDGEELVVLPGNITAWHESRVFARTNGYILEWKVDIGDKVKKGETLGVIATPELNASFDQAEAEVKKAEANYAIAQVTEKRWKILAKTESVSEQELDEKVSDTKSKLALLSAAQANRDRLKSLVDYETVTAPFDGVIAERMTDIGQLINEGNGQTPLFRLVQDDKLRIYVRLPQYYLSRFNPNMKIKLYFYEQPEKFYDAQLIHFSKAVDPSSRTMQLELMMDNPDHTIKAGSYAQVRLLIPRGKTDIQLPVNTLIFRSEGLQVATVDSKQTVLLKSIKLARDDGENVLVSEGLGLNERVILNPPDSIESGQKVTVRKSKDFST